MLAKLKPKKNNNVNKDMKSKRKKTTLPKGVCISETRKLNRNVLRLLHII